MIIHRHKEEMNAFESKTLCNIILDATTEQVSRHDSNVSCKNCLKVLAKGCDMNEIEKDNESKGSEQAKAWTGAAMTACRRWNCNGT